MNLYRVFNRLRHVRHAINSTILNIEILNIKEKKHI